MTDHDINDLLQHEIFFQGCFMRNEKLPEFGSFVLNLDGVRGEGTHWVLVELNKRVYYDPFGLHWPRELNKYEFQSFNSTQHQKPVSNLCGLYCIFALILLNRGHSFYDICYNVFKHHSYNKNVTTLQRLLHEMQAKH